MKSYAHIYGDIFDHQGEETALAHGVNCVGLMGAGIALSFRERYPEMYNVYRLMCQSKTLVPGGIFPWTELPDDTDWPPYEGYPPVRGTIINCATQDLPGSNARVEWLLSSLNLAAAYCNAQKLRLVVPEIGAGIGGIDRDIVFEVFQTIGELVPLTVVTFQK